MGVVKKNHVSTMKTKKVEIYSIKPNYSQLRAFLNIFELRFVTKPSKPVEDAWFSGQTGTIGRSGDHVRLLLAKRQLAAN